MKIKNNLLVLSIVSLVSVSSYVMAQNYVFRTPAPGVVSSTNDTEDTTQDNETDIACYDPSNIGEIGTENGCDGMLIVSREMLDTAYSINSGQDKAIYYDGKMFSFGDSEYNIFTGQVTDFGNNIDGLSSGGSPDDFLLGTKFNADIGYWDTGNVQSIEGLFLNSDFNQNISNWDTSNVINMRGAFSGSDFNQNISNWDTSSVTNMERLFGLSPFNQDISDWDVSNVIDMKYMFASGNFNQDITRWNVSSVINMKGMFNFNTAFNQDIGNWNVSNVTDMSNMFAGSYSNLSVFDKNIGEWDVSNVTDMSNMFEYSNFNQDIGNWNVSNVQTMYRMFYAAEKINQDLSGWDVQHISTRPTAFSVGAFAWELPRPCWGASPSSCTPSE